MALPFLFEFWAMDHQLPPDGDWRSWVILGGRGAGKTRAGAEWVRAMVEGPRPLDGGRASRVALVAETQDQARDVMIFGDSGIMACSPPDRRPKWEATKKRMVWPNGATAQIFSAHDPQGLRGPQFDAVWCDELAKWRNGQDTWDMLQFALRLGDDPHVCVTTTPRAVDVLKTLLASPSTVMTHAPTSANRANLAASFLAEVNARYAGTRLGRQELDGVLIDAVDGALWRDPDLAQLTVDTCPEFARVVVAVDSPMTGHARSDSCGIIVAGILAHDPTRAVVIADYSVQGTSPLVWAQVAIDAYHTHNADRLIAEVNQGGDLVETVIRQVDPNVSYRAIRASRGNPWPGAVAVSSNDIDTDPVQNLLVTQRGILGKIKTDLTPHSSAYPDMGRGVEVDIQSGALQSISQGALENGGNLAAIGVPETQHWEIIQFKWAELIAPNRYR